MTASEATKLLFSYFEGNDIFDIDKDFKKVVLISLNEEIEREIVLYALEQLVQINILGKSKDGNHFFLLKPLQSYEKTLTLSYEVVSAIVAIINEACDILGQEKDKINEISLSEKDIASLCWIVGEYQKQIKSNRNE